MTERILANTSNPSFDDNSVLSENLPGAATIPSILRANLGSSKWNRLGPSYSERAVDVVLDRITKGEDPVLMALMEARDHLRWGQRNGSSSPRAEDNYHSTKNWIAIAKELIALDVLDLDRSCHDPATRDPVRRTLKTNPMLLLIELNEPKLALDLLHKGVSLPSFDSSNPIVLALNHRFDRAELVPGDCFTIPVRGANGTSCDAKGQEMDSLIEALLDPGLTPEAYRGAHQKAMRHILTNDALVFREDGDRWKGAHMRPLQILASLPSSEGASFERNWSNFKRAAESFLLENGDGKSRGPSTDRDKLVTSKPEYSEPMEAALLHNRREIWTWLLDNGAHGNSQYHFSYISGSHCRIDGHTYPETFFMKAITGRNLEAQREAIRQDKVNGGEEHRTLLRCFSGKESAEFPANSLGKDHPMGGGY
jgi:hypothetical protein